MRYTRPDRVASEAVTTHSICLFLGESNVYTIGYIGKHKVVSTKLPAIGTQMREQIAAGSTTTRLLGETFLLATG